MRQAVILAVVGALLMAGALGRDLPDDVVREPLKAAGQGEASAFDSNHSNPVKEIWVTADNQILVELKEDEANRPNLFDLNGRTLVFTPDSAGGVFAPGQGPGVGGGDRRGSSEAASIQDCDPAGELRLSLRRPTLGLVLPGSARRRDLRRPVHEFTSLSLQGSERKQR